MVSQGRKQWNDRRKLPDDESLCLPFEEVEFLEETIAGDGDITSAIQAHEDGSSLRRDIFSDLQGLAAVK